MNFLKAGARKLNRYTRASLIAVVIYVVLASALNLARPLWEPILGPVENGHWHPIEAIGGIGLYILVLVVIFLSVRALRSINSTTEIGKTLSWLLLIGGGAVLIVSLLYLVMFIGMSPSKTNIVSEQTNSIDATIDRATLITTSAHPTVSGTAHGVSAVYVSLADKGEGIWHSEQAIPVVAGKWSITVSPDYSLPPSQYSIIVSGPDNPHNTLPALTTGTLVVTP